MSKKYTTNFLEDTNGSTGSANQVLISTPSGIDWVDGSGSSIIGGPYLPLAGGTMTGDLKLNDNVDLYLGTGNDFQAYHDGSNTYLRNLNGSFIIKQDKVDEDLIFESDNGSGGTTPYLQLDGSHTQTIAWKNIHFVDGVKAKFGDYASPDLEIYHDGSHSYIRDQGSGNLIITGSQLTFSNVADTEYMVKMVQDGPVELYYDGSKKLETTSTGVTVTGAATATTFLGDLNGTINTATTAVTKANATNDTTVATTAFVQNLIGTIPAGLVFQGTWNAATNTPTLASGTGTTGNFYIVSVDGSTNLDGITDWKVGDWAVFVEQGASDQWEKVDNSSVLDGAGTGQTVALWSGSGTSNTLTDAPITVSGNDTTFAANVSLSGGSLSISGDGNNAVTLTESDNGDFTIDAPDDIRLDAGGGDVVLRTGGTEFGRISSFSNALRLTSSVANEDILLMPNGTGNVGIGTPSPSQKLHVVGKALITDDVQLTGSNPRIDFNSNGASSLRFYDTTNVSERMRIDTAGNVGIGTTTPQKKLDVYLGTNSAVASVGGQISSGEYAGLHFGYSEAGNSLYRHSAIVFERDDSGFGDARGNIHILNSPSGSASADLGDARLTILPSGNVGIGETNPLTKLHIAGTTDANIIRIENTSTALSQGDTIGAIQFFNNDTTDDSPNIAASIYATAGPSGGSGSLRFKTTEPGTEGDPATDTMIITNGGYVGIGTDSPGAELEVSLSGNPRIRLTSTNNTTSTLQFADADDVNVGFIQYDHGVDAMEFRVNDAERMRITSTGGISFGTTGTAYGNSGQILKSNANASPTWVDASTVIGGPYLPLSAGLSYPLTGDLFIEGDSTPKITLTDTTNNLEGRIRVANNFMYIEADDSDTVASTVMLLKTDGVEALRLDGNQDATFAGTIAVQGTGDSYFQGDVGIGRSSSITARLFVEGPTDTATISTSSTPAARINNGGAISNWIGSNGYNYGYIQSIQDDGSNNLKPLALQPLGGNVGIGVTNPASAKLDIVATGQATKISTAAGQTHIGLTDTTNSKNGYINYNNDVLQYFSHGPIERMRIDSSGNVGIGVTSLVYKLEVAGTINQTAINNPPSDDLNNLDSTRFFKTHTATTNAPAGISSFGMGWTIAYATNQTVQFLTSRASSQPVYYRKQSNGTYSSWIRLRDENQISDTDISNWDAAYTYSQVGHLPLTGGTLTGDLYLDDGDGATPSLYFKNGADNYWRYLMESGGDFSVKEGTSTRLTFQAGGNVGIGVTSPGKKLTVDADTTPYQGIKIQGVNAPALTLFHTTGTATDNYIYALGNASSIQGVIVISADDGDTGDNSGIRFRVDGDEYFRIEPGIIDAWNNRITNVANPIVGDDAANKTYVDNAVTGASTFRENKAFFTSWKINTTATSFLNVTAGGDQSSLGYDGLMVIPFDGKLEQVTVITDVTQAGFTFSLIDYTGAALWTSSSTTLTANSVTTFTPGTTITKSTHIMVGLKMVRGTQAVNNADINITVTYEWDT